MLFLWLTLCLIRFNILAMQLLNVPFFHFFKMFLIIRSFHMHITLINRLIQFINAKVKIGYSLKELGILIFWIVFLVKIIVITIYVPAFLKFLSIAFLILMKAIAGIRKTWRLKNEIFSLRDIPDSSSSFLIFRRSVIWIENLVIRIQCRDRTQTPIDIRRVFFIESDYSFIS